MSLRLSEIEALLRAKKAKSAEVKITRALRMTLPAHMQAELLILRARAKLLTSRPEGGLEDISKATQLHAPIVQQPHVQELQADCLFARYELSALGFAERSDWVNAERIYTTLLEANPNYDNAGWVSYQLGRLLLSDNRIEQALAAFHTALLQSSHVIALTSYAFERLAFIASYEQRDFRQALVYLDKSIQTYPLSEDRAWLVQAYFLRGRILRDMHRLQEAVQTAEAALKLTTQRGLPRASLLEALFNAAEIFSRAEHQHERVIAVLEQYLSLSKRPPGVSVSWSRAYEMLADAYFSAGHYERAATSYLAALQYNPYHPWEYALYLRAARAYYQQGLYDQTQRIVQRAIQGAESEGQTIDFRAYDLLGSAYYALNKFPQSVEAFDKALALIPSNDASKPKIVQYRQYATEAQARDNGTTPS